MDKAAFERAYFVWYDGKCSVWAAYSALIVYVLLKFFYDAGSSIVPRHASLAFPKFSRLLLHDQLPKIWLVKLSLLRERYVLFQKSNLPLSG